MKRKKGNKIYLHLLLVYCTLNHWRRFSMYESFIYIASLLCLLFATFNSALVFLEYILQILGQEHSLEKINWQIIDLSSEEVGSEPETQEQTGISQ